MCNFIESLFSNLEVHNIDVFIKLSFITMRNEDIVEAMKQLELNFKQHTEAQFASYTKLLKQYMSSTNHRFGQLHQQVTNLAKAKAL